MISRYGIFCTLVEVGNFTKVAEIYNYTQSAVSQSVKSLEKEIGVTLIQRKKEGINLTSDGKQYLPYIKAIYVAEKALEQKKKEMMGLKNSTIKIGTFTSVSRNILPSLMNSFREKYPSANFFLGQGDYTIIEEWIVDEEVDFGFVNEEAVSSVETYPLYMDEMAAVLYKDHPLADKEILSLSDLKDEPIILLAEGEYNVTLKAFEKEGISPKIEYEVYDDYTIFSMIKQKLGISIMYKTVISDFEEGLKIKPISNAPKRTVALAWKDKNTIPYAAKEFIDYIISSNNKASK